MNHIQVKGQGQRSISSKNRVERDGQMVGWRRLSPGL